MQQNALGATCGGLREKIANRTYSRIDEESAGEVGSYQTPPSPWFRSG
jgi:hypothetical protein